MPVSEPLRDPWKALYKYPTAHMQTNEPTASLAIYFSDNSIKVDRQTIEKGRGWTDAGEPSNAGNYRQTKPGIYQSNGTQRRPHPLTLSLSRLLHSKVLLLLLLPPFVSWVPAIHQPSRKLTPEPKQRQYLARDKRHCSLIKLDYMSSVMWRSNNMISHKSDVMWYYVMYCNNLVFSPHNTGCDPETVWSTTLSFSVLTLHLCFKSQTHRAVQEVFPIKIKE